MLPIPARQVVSNATIRDEIDLSFFTNCCQCKMFVMNRNSKTRSTLYAPMRICYASKLSSEISGIVTSDHLFYITNVHLSVFIAIPTFQRLAMPYHYHIISPPSKRSHLNQKNLL